MKNDLYIEGEEWRPIPTAPGYEVSNLGRVRRISILAGTAMRRGYPAVNLSLGRRGQSWMRQVHTLVAEAFLGPRPSPAHVVSHLDGNPANPSVTNLTYETQKENLARRKQHGTDPVGDRNPSAKLTTEDVLAIREDYDNGAGPREIAARYGVDRSTVHEIVRRTSWTHLP